MSESRTYEDGQQNARDECLQFLREQNPTAFRSLQQWLAGRGHQIQIDFTKVVQQPTKIKEFPSEILVNIFDRLSIEEKVKARRVWREWSSTINNHRKLWRKLVVRKWIWSGGREWEQSILGLFDDRSASTLEEVDIEGFIIQDSDMAPLMQLLEKSKTLKTLRIHFVPQADYGGETEDLSSGWSKFPSITDYRVTDQTTNVPPMALLYQKTRRKSQDEEPEKLQVLWGWFFSYQLLPNIQLLSNLKSFYCHITIDLVTLRKVLDEPSKTLVHLRLSIDSDYLGEESPTLPILQFPKLKALEIFDPSGDDVGSFIVMPSDSILILDINRESEHPTQFPKNVNHLWTNIDLNDWESLLDSCPSLKTLKYYDEHRTTELTKEERGDMLWGLLCERENRRKRGEEIDGVAISRIETLWLDFDQFEVSDLDLIERQVGQCVDMEGSTRWRIEVEI